MLVRVTFVFITSATQAAAAAADSAGHGNMYSRICVLCVCVFVSGQTGSWTQARLEFRVDAQTHKSSRCYGRSSNGEVVNAAVAAKTATIATACLRSQLII